MCCRREYSPYAFLQLLQPQAHKVEKYGGGDGDWSPIEEGSPQKGRRLGIRSFEANSGEQAPAKSSMCPRLRCCCGVLLTLVFGVLAGTFAVPHEPSWMLDELRLVDVSFPKVGDNASSIELHFEAMETVENPNYIAMPTEPADLSIFYHGELIGSDSIQALRVGSRSNVTVPVSVTVDSMPEALAVAMMKDLAESRGFLEVEARGRMMTKVFMSLDVECVATCHLTADVKNPPEFRGRACTSDCNLWKSLPLPPLPTMESFPF